MSSSDAPIVIVDYGMGNLRSVSKMLGRMHLNCIVSSRAADVLAASRLILPGVGAFAEGMRNLANRGLIEPLTHAVTRKGTPLLGICLGMELLAQESEEHGLHEGLGWLPARVRRLSGAGGVRVPHVGWNRVRLASNNPLFEGIPDGATFYFTHSYLLECQTPEVVTATCDYGETFAAAVQLKNVFGCQFHPEKSQRNGGILLHRFASQAAELV